MTKVRDREQLIDAAARVFAEKGFAAARLEDIAAELGILKGSLYYHAASKRELLQLVQRRRHYELNERAAAIAAGAQPPLDKLAVILRFHLQRIDAFYPESLQWLTAAPMGRREHEAAGDERSLLHAFQDIIRGVIEEAIACGACRADVDPTIAALGLLGMCNWSTRWYRRDGRLSMGEIADTFVSMALDGLRKQESAC